MAKIELTEEALANLLSAAGAAGAKAALEAMQSKPAQSSSPLSVEESPGQYAEIMRAMRERPAPESKTHDCISPMTGSSFRAVLNAAGVVVQLEDYKHPEGVKTYQAEGGLVPDGSPMEDGFGKPHPHYKQWLWTEFWQADLRTYVGKPFTRGLARTALENAAAE